MPKCCETDSGMSIFLAKSDHYILWLDEIWTQFLGVNLGVKIGLGVNLGVNFTVRTAFLNAPQNSQLIPFPWSKNLSTVLTRFKNRARALAVGALALFFGVTINTRS